MAAQPSAPRGGVVADALTDDLLQLVERQGPAADAARQPDQQAVKELASRGMMRLVVPASMGGVGGGPAELIELTRQLSAAHPSTGWVAMTCNEEATLAATYLNASSLKALYGREPDAVIAGSGVPRGTARLTDDGCVISGRWSFATGCTAADYWVVTALVEGPSPRPMCAVLLPAVADWVDDTWHTLGMRGTGSADIVLDEVHVPDEWLGVADRAGVLDPRGAGTQPPAPDAHPFFNLAPGLRFPFPKVGVAVGTAQRAIEAFKRLATEKQPLFTKHTLAHRPDAHAAVARAEALVRSAHAFALEQLDAVCQLAADDQPVEPPQHALGRLACSWTLQSCIEAVGLLASAAGSTSNFTDAVSPSNAQPSDEADNPPVASLASLLADVRAVAGHFMVGPQQIDTAGRVLLGLDAGDPNF